MKVYVSTKNINKKLLNPEIMSEENIEIDLYKAINKLKDNSLINKLVTDHVSDTYRSYYWDAEESYKLYSMLIDKFGRKHKKYQKVFATLEDVIKDESLWSNYGYSSFRILRKVSRFEIFPNGRELQKELLFDVADAAHRINGPLKGLIVKTKEFLDTEEDIVNFLNAYHEHMTPLSVRHWIGKVKEGVDHPDISFSQKTKFKLLKLRAADMKDVKTRTRAVRSAVDVNGAMNYLCMKVSLSKDDLLYMPPVARLKFLEWYFDAHLSIVFEVKRCPSNIVRELVWVKSANKNGGQSKVELTDKLSTDDIREMLFPVSLSKNDRVSRFVKQYEAAVELGII